ncbi:MAG: N-6 DNA methylase [Bacteroidales bacterium]|nr:N-6 DNA methylase [Bacteroidales bacterium]
MKIERQLQGTLNTIFTELIKEKGLEGKIQPYPAQEEFRADITLKNKNGKPIFFIELKDPTARDGKSVFDSDVLMREVERAQRLDIKYFGNCNFLACAFFERDKLYDRVSVNEGFFSLLDIYRLSVSYSPSKEIENKLRNIAEFYLDRALEILDRKPITFSNLDELFIFKIRKLIEVYSHPISVLVWEKFNSDKAFHKEIAGYAQKQLWNKPSSFEEIENLTHIGVLMLISKLIFYKAYADNATWRNLPPIHVPHSVNTPENLEEIIWQYFTEFKEITRNFELLIGERSDIVFKIPFVSDASIDLVKDILDAGGHYNFSNIPFDIIGRIFEELIREDERHKLGQYFTPPHVIDLINAFAIRKSNDKVFDPSCGSGTFLVRAYERKKALAREEDKGVKHEIFLNEIYGNDLSNYPVYLSMLNLAIRDTRRPSYPRIVNKDFFAITEHLRLDLHNQKGIKEKKILPKFDAIVGNPPYTRQEEIGSMHGTVTKSQIQKLIKTECGFEPSQRTSIFAYFFYHSGVFLKDGGYLAFICQNSWLDTDYGIDMQRHLLRNYEIIAIMDSEVERFFPSASVNTTIVILRKQREEKKRNKNIVKFIWCTDSLANTIRKYKGVDDLREYFFEISQNTENEFFRINCITQETLANHTKWGQFLKAPKVYFDILSKGADKFVPLKQLANVKFGIKTGCNEFFILEDKTETATSLMLAAALNNSEKFSTIEQLKDNRLRLVLNGFNELWLIEEIFLTACIKSPKDLNSYTTSGDCFLYQLIFTDLPESELRSYKFVTSYLKSGVRKQIDKRPTCASRNLWYNIKKEKPSDILWPEMYFDRYFVCENSQKIMEIDKFYGIYLNSAKQRAYYSAILNSTFYQLHREFISFSSLGDGITKTPVYSVKDIPVPNFEKSSKIVSIWNKLKSKKTYSLETNKIESLRIELDKVFLEIIGFSKLEIAKLLPELYESTIKIIEARLLKAQSLKGVKAQRNKVAFSAYTNQLKDALVEGRFEAKKTFKFARQLQKLSMEITSDTRLQKKILDSYWKEKFGVQFDEKEIAKNEQATLF